jgi:hypothetical protein
MIAYLSPTVGLGCRSGGYFIYGVAATISWALLTCSALLCHSVNLQYQDIYTGRQEFLHRKETTDPEDSRVSTQVSLQEQATRLSVPINLLKHRRTMPHATMAFLAVTTRIVGKLIASLNACWIVVSAILEYTGVYDSCYCGTNADVTDGIG